MDNMYVYVLIRQESTGDDWDPYSDEFHGVYTSERNAIRAMREYEHASDVASYELYRCVINDEDHERYLVGIYDADGTITAY